MSMERKAYKVEMKANVDKREIEGYASVFGNLDSHEDVTLKGAFSESIKTDFSPPGGEGKNRVKVLWQHMHTEPIGRPLSLSEDDNGLHFKATLVQGVQRADEALALIKEGVIDEMSFGYDTIDAEMGDMVVGGVQKRVRMLKTLKLWEISPVTWGSNPQAEVQRAKSMALINAKLTSGSIDLQQFSVMLAELKAMVDNAVGSTGAKDDEKDLAGLFSDFNQWINERK